MTPFDKLIKRGSDSPFLTKIKMHLLMSKMQSERMAGQSKIKAARRTLQTAFCKGWGKLDETSSDVIYGS